MIIEFAPAKVNLYLKVVRRRHDGYHDIETLFERINIVDKVSIMPDEGNISLTHNSPDIPQGKDNLCFKAALLLRQKCKIGLGARISLEKNIPVAAGLGGGSSDAAGVLKGLNKLWKLNLSANDLVSFGAEIGSDVPFFLRNDPFAIGTLRGDALKALKITKKLWHVVITPSILLLAKDIYKGYDEMKGLALTRHMSADRIRLPAEGVDNVGRMNAILHNDLENTVLHHEPIIKDIRDCLSVCCGKKAIVSGSGPSVFCVCETRKEAAGVRDEFTKRTSQNKGWRIFVAETY